MCGGAQVATRRPPAPCSAPPRLASPRQRSSGGGGKEKGRAVPRYRKPPPSGYISRCQPTHPDQPTSQDPKQPASTIDSQRDKQLPSQSVISHRSVSHLKSQSVSQSAILPPKPHASQSAIYLATQSVSQPNSHSARNSANRLNTQPTKQPPSQSLSQPNSQPAIYPAKNRKTQPSK